MAHNQPIAGHFGRVRTLHALIVSGLAWNKARMSIIIVSCPALISKALAHSLSIIPEPFTRIAIDVFEPSKETKSGNTYKLAVMNYTSKWRDAYALKNVTCETVGSV